MRVKRVEKKSEGQEVQEQREPRTYTTIVDLVKKKIEVGLLSPKEIQAIVDVATEEEEQAKEMAANVKAAKGILLAYAEEFKMKTIAGENAFCNVKPSSSTEVGPIKMLQWLDKNKKEKLFPEIFSVQVGQARKYLGDDVVDNEVGEKTTEEYGKVELRRR